MWGVGGYTEAKVGEVVWSHQRPLESSGLLRRGHWDMGPTQRQDSKRDPHTDLLAHRRAKAGRADPPSEEDRGLGKGGVWLRQVFQGLGPQHRALGSI